MPPKKKAEPKRECHVGQQIKVNMHTGKVVDTDVKAVVPKTDGLRLYVTRVS